MKKMIVALMCAACVLLSGMTVTAKECPLPEPNTDVEINFDGFDWYCDYSEAKAFAEEKGIKYITDSFKPDMRMTAHWTFIQDPGNYYSDCEKDCGGYLYCGEAPQVAGYDLDHTALHFMLSDPNEHELEDYAEDGAVEFYMGVYFFDASDPEYCYNDLAEKLKGIYGENPTIDEKYMYWLNKDGAMVGLVNGGVYGVSLMYMAPGAEEKLCEVERLVAENEKLNAEGNTSGL